MYQLIFYDTNRHRLVNKPVEIYKHINKLLKPIFKKLVMSQYNFCLDTDSSKCKLYFNLQKNLQTIVLFVIIIKYRYAIFIQLSCLRIYKYN